MGHFSKKRAPKGYFLGGLFSGSGGSSTTNQNSTTTMHFDPAYEDLMHKVLGRASGLMDTPYTPYTGQRFADFTSDQNAGFQSVRDAQNAWQPYTDAARTAFGNAANPANSAFSAGNPYIAQAAGMTTGSQAQQPYFSQASQTWPGAVDQYMNPYLDQVTNRIQTLGNRNLTENILPQINDAFTRDGGAAFGRDRHAEFTQRALRDSQDAILGAQGNALAQGYGQGANIFGSDMSRVAGLGSAAGTQANADIGTRAGLGTTAGGLANASNASNIALGQAQGQLGQNVQGSEMRDAQALVTSGGLQQQHGQQQQDFNYQQFINQLNWPFQMAQFGQQSGQGWQLPYTSNTQSQSTQQNTPAQGSPFGNILGAVSGIASMIPGIGQIAGGIGSLGGMLGFEEGGSVPAFGAGGHAPTVRGIRDGVRRRGAFGRQPPPPMPMMKCGGHFSRRYADGGEVERRFRHPLDLMWGSLPPEARHAYGSGVDALKWGITNLTPPAGVRDFVEGSRTLGRGFFGGDSEMALEGLTDMGAGAFSLIPGVGLVPKGARAFGRAVR